MAKAYRNILIIKPSSLGDLVLALPALTALRNTFPQARISWLVRPEFAPLLRHHPHLHEVILFHRKLLGKAWFHPRAFAELLNLVRLLRHRRFDVVFDLQGLFRSAALARATGAAEIFGTADAREFAPAFYTHVIAPDNRCTHLVDYYMKVVRAAGAEAEEAQFVLPTTPEAERAVTALLNDCGIANNDYAVLIPGSRRPEKCWPIERFAQVAERIYEQLKLNIVAIGSAAEKPLLDELRRLSAVDIVNLAGRTTLEQLVALLKNAVVVVTNDTGPGHIAAALGKPMVMIFGRVNPGRLAPYRRPECVAAVEPFTRPPGIRSNDRKYDVDAVTVEAVYEKLLSQLDRGNARGGD